MNSLARQDFALYAIVGLVAVLPWEGFTAFLKVGGVVIPSAIAYVLFAACLPVLPAVIREQPRAMWLLCATYGLGTAIAIGRAASEGPELSWRVTTIWQQLGLCALITYAARKPDWDMRLMRTLLGSLGLVFTLYLLFYAAGVEVIASADRARRVANYQTNVVGAAATLATLMALTTWDYWSARMRRFLLFCLLPTGALVLLVANSRSAFAGLACGILVFAAPGAAGSGWIWRRRLAGILSLFLVAATLAVFEPARELLTRPAQRWRGFQEYPTGDAARAEILAVTVELAGRHPGGLGTGNSSRAIAERFRGGRRNNVDAHSDYGTVLLETGVAGLVLFLVAFLSLLRHAWKRFRAKVVWPLTLLTAILGMSLFHTTGHYKLRWIALGLVAASAPPLVVRTKQSVRSVETAQGFSSSPR